MKDYCVLEHEQEEANSAKDRLIEIEFKLRDAGFIRKENSLSKIIGELEHWQNS